MASKIRKKDAPVIDRLIGEPHKFTFFQAVRLLVASGGAPLLGAPKGEIGTSKNAAEESVRFQTTPALQFPSCEVSTIRKFRSRRKYSPEEHEASGQEASEEHEVSDEHENFEVDLQRPVEVEVPFWGLIGPVGALPNHYTQLVIDRVRRGDHNLHDFLALFSHRQLSFFYRAWEKHFVPSGFERALREDKEELDTLREALLSIVGRGTNRLRRRLEVLDDVCVYYGGQFVDPPNAESLRQILADYLLLAVQILSLYGDWLRLPKSEQSRLGMGHSRLGEDTVLGERTWDPAAKFRIRIGPVSYPDFARLMPIGDRLVPTSQLVRSYVGCEYDFDLQVVLRAEEIPPCELGDSSGRGNPPNLGWNTWLCSRTPVMDSDDAVFHHDGSPALY